MTIPLTALVVVRDEAHLLERCLSPLNECDQVLVIDLESSDGSAEMANTLGAEVVSLPAVEAAEHVLPDAVRYAENDWVIRIDPDETVSASLLKEVIRYIGDPAIGIVEVPIRHLFAGAPLDYSIWGGIRYQPRVFHRNRVIMNPSGQFHAPSVTEGSGWTRKRIRASSETTISHQWVDSYAHFLRKHRRYIRLEAAADYAEGVIISLPRVLIGSLGAVWRSFFTSKGWRGGPRGWILSALYGWYVGRTRFLLWRSVRRASRPDALDRTPRVLPGPNLDPKTVESFGDEWETFDQRHIPERELRDIFDLYFEQVDWSCLPADAHVLDLGCGSGRWARFTAERAENLLCVDASWKALEVAQVALAGYSNCSFVNASAGALPIMDESLDMAYSLGVLHHIPDTAGGIRSVASKLKPGAPLVLYVYYALENRPIWFRWLWSVSNVLRHVISRLPHAAKASLTAIIAAVVYLPLARLARFLERRGVEVGNFPLSIYRRKGFYTMRTDAYDRFGTSLEQRFSREEIREMLVGAGLEDIAFAEGPPFWRVIARKARS